MGQKPSFWLKPGDWQLPARSGRSELAHYEIS